MTSFATAETSSSAPPARTHAPAYRAGPDVYAFLGAIATPLLIVAVMAGLWSVLGTREQRRRELALAAMPKPVKLDAAAYARGKQLYAMACVACHGAEGQGVAGLGRDLTRSRFTRDLNDAQLASFIMAGRAADDPLNVTRVPMPPRGGRADFTDHNIADVVAFLRGLSDPRRLPDGPLPEVEIVLGEAPEEPEPAVAAAPAAPDAQPIIAAIAPAPAAAAAVAPVTLDAQAIARGKKAYVSCLACHGKDARGVKNMGKDLVANPFVAGLDDQALADFIKKGRGPTDPGNTTKIAMPPKGGNPALKDAQIVDIVVYLRSLQQAAGVAVTGKPAVATPAPAAAPTVAPIAVAAAPAPAPALAPVAQAPAVALAATPAPVKAAIASAGDAIARGKKAYISCIACHGKNGTGVKNMGKDLVNSPFVVGLSDEALVDFIKKGRGPTDPGNTTKIGMPPKGGNPALKDEQIKDIVAYLRSLRQQSADAR